VTFVDDENHFADVIFVNYFFVKMCFFCKWTSIQYCTMCIPCGLCGFDMFSYFRLSVVLHQQS